MNEPSASNIGASLAALITRCVAGCLLALPSHALAGDPPFGASARIDVDLTPAGHVGADVTVTFPGPQAVPIDDWGEPRIEGETIFLDATSGEPYAGGVEVRHAYKLFDVHRPPVPQGAAVPFRTVAFPNGTSPIPEGEVVLRSRREWDEWIAPYDLTAGPLPIAPPVDFERDIFVGVFLGPTSGCHAVEIRRMTARDDGTILVEYTAAIPAPDKPVTEALIHPRHVVAVSRTDAPFNFVREVSVVPAPATPVPVTRPGYPFIAPEQPMTVAIRDDAAWGRFLDRVAGERDPALPAPPVDLAKEMLIGVFLGRTPLGRGVTILDVTDNGQELLVRIEETIGGVAPPPDEFTFPLDFVAVPSSALPVRFVRTTLALPSPPPEGGPNPRGATPETPHGSFEVIFRLDGCEVARSGFYFPEVSTPGRVVLDALPSESASAVTLDASFDLGLTVGSIVDWEPPVRSGQNIFANVTVYPKPQVPVDDPGFPGSASFAHRYALADLIPGLYRFELRVNGSVAGHVFFQHPAAGVPASAFEAWLAALLIRPVWEPVPAAGWLGDLDGDGADDFLEYALRGDPLDAGRRPQWQVRPLLRPGRAPGMEFTLTRRSNVTVDLEQSPDLRRDWQIAAPAPEVMAEPIEGAPDFESLTLRWFAADGTPAPFLRLRAAEVSFLR